MMVRVADQAGTSFKRTFVFANLSALSYILLIAYLILIEGREVALPVEGLKLICIYGFNLNIALTARTAESLRRRLVEAIRISRSLNEDLRRQTERAEAANLAKSRFLANMSHELRTPLNAIIGFANLLGKPGLDPKKGNNYLGRIQANGRHLLGIINGILDLALIEAGKVDVRREPVQLDALIHDVVAGFEPSVPRGVELRTEMPPLDPIESDGEKWRQMLVNLVGNSLKFTSEGQVTISVAATDDGHPVRVDVTDSGIGIEPEKQAVVFEAFEQADGSAARLYAGTGLGLAISKQLAELLGCELTLESEPGKGTRVSIHCERDVTDAT